MATHCCTHGRHHGALESGHDGWVDGRGVRPSGGGALAGWRTTTDTARLMFLGICSLDIVVGAETVLLVFF